VTASGPLIVLFPGHVSGAGETKLMATVYVTLPPSNNGQPRPDAIELDVVGEKLKAIAIDIGDARLNLIQAAAKGGIEIPFFC